MELGVSHGCRGGDTPAQTCLARFLSLSLHLALHAGRHRSRERERESPIVPYVEINCSVRSTLLLPLSRALSLSPGGSKAAEKTNKPKQKQIRRGRRRG